MLEAAGLVTGVRERSLPDPGCSAAQSRSSFNLTSWSSYREFTDHSPCQADLATNRHVCAGQGDSSWETVPARRPLQSSREGGRRPRLGREGGVHPTWKEGTNCVLNIKIIKDSVLTVLSFLPAMVSMLRREILKERENEWGFSCTSHVNKNTSIKALSPDLCHRAPIPSG